MPDSKVINNPFLDEQNTTKVSQSNGSKFDPSTAKPVANTTQDPNNKNTKFDPSTAKAVDKGFGGHIRDLGASLMGGLASVPDVAVGVADLYSGGRAGKAVDNLSDNFKLGDGRKYWQDQKTDHAKVQSQEFADAEGIIDKTKVALSNPSMITNTVVESLPSMALGGLAGRGLNVASKGLINPVAAGAAGEGLVMAGAQAEQIRQETDDGLLTGKQVAAAAGTGVVGGLLGFLGGTVAKKLGFEDVDTLMARGVKPEQMANEISQIPFSSIPKSVVLGAISEGLLEEMPQSVTEQVLQNYALDKDLFEGVDDAIVMGTLAGMAMGGTVAGASQASKWAGQPNTGNSEANDDTDTTGSTPMLPAPTGGNGGAPGLSYDGLQGEYIPAGQQDSADPVEARQNFEYDQMSTDADNLINYDGQSPQSAPKPSEQMGLDPNLGPLSAAATTAVDSGMSQQMQIEMQAQSAAESTSKSTEKTTDSNTPLQQAADAARSLSPEQIHGAKNKYSPEVISVLESLRQRQAEPQTPENTDATYQAQLDALDQQRAQFEAAGDYDNAEKLYNDMQTVSREWQTSRPKASKSNQKTEYVKTESDNAWSDFYKTNRHMMGDDLFEGGHKDKSDLKNAPKEIQSRSAHGMAKSTPASAVNDLKELLTNGIDPNRGDGRLYTAPLNNVIENDEDRRAASMSGTSSGSSYGDGAFTLVAKEGVGDIYAVSDVDAVMVNSSVPKSVVEGLRKDFPEMKIGYASELPTLLSGSKQSNNAQLQVAELESQLTNEKSVPKKAQIRKQIAELQQGLTDQTQSEANINGPQKATVDNLRDDFAKMDRSIAKVNAVRQRMREANPEIFTEENDRVRETHGLTNARVSAIADEIESSGSYELSDREYDKVKNNPNYKIDYNPKTFIGKVTAVKDQHSGEWVGDTKKPAGDLKDNDDSTLTNEGTTQPPGKTEKVYTPGTNREIEVRHKVVEADSLITSNDANGAVNPNFPKHLQPRDRSRPTSIAQVHDIASKLNPKLLGENPSTASGAPIVSAEGVVESGNGRTMAIRKAYEQGKGDAYRKWLSEQGHDVSGMKNPVLVRERTTLMSDQELLDYTKESNESTTLTMSPTEQAMVDAKAVVDLLNQYRGGDINSAANRDFVNRFVTELVPTSERGKMLSAGTGLTQDGQRRINAALVAAAYNDTFIVDQVFESTESDIKAIGNALTDVAGFWAKMRDMSITGQIPKDLDITLNLVEAVHLVQKARVSGTKLAELVAQDDIFSGAVDPVTLDFLSVFYRGDKYTRARGRERVADALNHYAQQAMQQFSGENLFGDKPKNNTQLRGETLDRLDQQETDKQQDIFASPQSDDANTGTSGRTGQRTITESPDAKTDARNKTEVKSKSSKSTIEKPKEIIQDFGEKIGGARKDTAVKTGKKSAVEKPKDDRPTWAKRFEISEIAASSNPAEVGKWAISDTKNKDWMGNNRRLTNQMFDSQEEAEKFLPVAAVAMKHRVTTDTQDGKKGYIIVRTVSDRKRVQVVQQLFDTREAANEYLVRHAQEILETNTIFGELDLPRPENTQRTGVARREGDAKDSDFSRVFGFRGVEFGNWNNQVERQELLNDAFDGLMDLAEVLNIPPEALSLNGELALAFGARGQGLSSAKAHYESSRVVINLTKMNGAGSLAHEWWHAFDHYLSRQDGSASSAWIQHEDGSRSLNVKANPADRFASHGFRVVKSGVREDVRNAFEKLMVTMFKKSQAYMEDTQAADEFVARSRDEVQDKLNSIRENLTKQLDPQYYKRFNKPASADQLVEFDTAAELIITGQLLETEARNNPKSRSTFGGYRHTNDALDKINEIFKAVRGRSGFNADFKGVLDYLRGSMSRYLGRLKMLAEAQQSTTKYKSVPTEFAMNAKELDQGRGSDYWTTPHEMSARAFQGYVEDKISAKNARSPFLNYGPENVGILTPYGVKRPFPSGEERVAINQAFDDLIGGLQTEKTETGQRLYSRVDGQNDQGSTPEQVREALVERFGEKTISSLERRGLLDIISTVDEPGVEGFYQNGRVTLVASNLNETSIIPTFLHELGGHGGFQNTMDPEQYADLMGIFNDMVKRKHPLALEAKRLAERETDIKTQQLEYLPYLLTLASTQQEMNALQKSAIKRFIDKVVSAVKAWAFDRLGINLNLNENDMVALANRMVNQIGNQAQQNTDTNQNPLYSRQANAQQIIQNLVGNMNKQGREKIKTEAGYKATHALQYVLGALGRRQLAELYQKLLPQLKPYSDMVAMMDADQNEVAALSDDLARRWADLQDEKELANIMHDATLAKIDPAKPYQPGDNIAEYTKLKKQFDALTGDAKKVYREARDAYKKHHRDVRQAIQERILRSSMSNQKKTELLQQMDANFFGYTQGVYFPLQRFGKYVVLVRDTNDQVISVSRAETLSEAHKLREILQGDYPKAKVHKPMLDKEYDAARDGVGRGFMTNLFNELGSFGLNTQRQAELEDILGQLYLKSLPDLSYAKHSVHRKGTAGFSQDARRAFAQNMFHGGSYLAKLRYKDQLEEMLDGMQKHATEQAKIDDDYDQPVAQQVIDEMNKRHKNMMEANSHPLSTALTSLGFLYYLGLSPASAAVNTLQTVLVAYPQMGAKWGYDKAGSALAKASNDFRKGVSINGINPKSWENDIGKILKGDELKAYEEAVRRGVIDVTMAHDLAGIAQGEDSGVMWKLRPIMRVASTLFHNAERFNREVTFIAAYRLARDSGSMHDQAFEQAMDSTYKGHFDYSSGNRPRIMQGNIAKVILLFKQFGQNMIYTLARTAHQSLKGETPEARREAQRALAGIVGMHTVFAGVMGLPLVGPILVMASMLGSDDDEPWDAEAALRNALADALGTKTSEVLMKGASRFGPADLSGRVGINNLLLPDVQDGLEGKDFSDAMVMSALGPVVGILTNTFKGLAEMGQGHGMRGVETMSPVFLRSPLRSIRYATEGAQDKTGVMIKDDVGMLSLASQAIGFSPSEVRLATEGRSAIYSHTKRLDNRRTELMTDYVRAIQREDADGQKELWAEIQEFNQKNPSRRISRVQAMQSLRQREKRVTQAEHGIYLPNKKREDADIGRFAFDE